MFQVEEQKLEHDYYTKGSNSSWKTGSSKSGQNPHFD